MKVLRKAFKQPLNPAVTKFISSIKEDQHLIAADIKGSQAHVQMLAKVGLISEKDAIAISHGLNELLRQYESGELILETELEDVHMNIEHKLEKMIGSAARLLHTARSRNDQVALDARLYVIAETEKIVGLLDDLCDSLSAKGAQYSQVVMPGYTHLQRAQPISFAHALQAFVEMFKRDMSRFLEARKRCEQSPLGAGALAGSSLPIDPQFSASQLGMCGTFTNSIDAVSDRDFIADFVYSSAMTAIHLSQLAETIIIWCSTEFGFIQLPDSLTTASSLMPQKKNPDPVEIIRAKAGTICGELLNIMMTLKALNLGYNRDLQETKAPAIQAAQVLEDSLAVMDLVVEGITVCPEKTLAAANDANLVATDMVEYLIGKGVAFRTAHEAVSQLVSFAKDASTPMPQLPLSAFKQFSAAFDESVFALFDPASSVASKTSPGGTGAYHKRSLSGDP
ncbi:MAG TPA: argininosuccinate lyase [Candidatus Obscuribacterales bacterium]